MTLPAIGGRPNTRFRDLVDLVLLIELIEDLPAFHHACVAVFSHRATHAWPPRIDIPGEWVLPYRALAEEVGLAATDAGEAALLLRAFLHRAEVAALHLQAPSALQPADSE